MLLDYLEKVEDNRGRQGQVYKQSYILFFSVLAMLNGATSYRKMHTFINEKFSFLKNRFNLPWKKAPAYTSIRGIIQSVNQKSLEEQFRAYTKAISRLKSDNNLTQIKT